MTFAIIFLRHTQSSSLTYKNKRMQKVKRTKKDNHSWWHDVFFHSVGLQVITHILNTQLPLAPALLEDILP